MYYKISAQINQNQIKPNRLFIHYSGYCKINLWNIVGQNLTSRHILTTLLVFIILGITIPSILGKTFEECKQSTITLQNHNHKISCSEVSTPKTSEIIGQADVYCMTQCIELCYRSEFSDLLNLMFNHTQNKLYITNHIDTATRIK